MSANKPLDAEGFMEVHYLHELTNEQIIRCEDLITNLNECNGGCPGNCQTCGPLIARAVEQGYLTREEVIDIE
jgi:hypothetical protein